MIQKLTTICMLFLCVIFSIPLKAQIHSWSKSINASNINTELLITNTTKDTAGNIYNIGTFSGTADFDPSSSVFVMSGNLNGSDMFIQKLNNSGNLVWAKKIGGSNAILSATKIKTDHLDNVIIVGTFDDTVDFNPSPTTNNIINKGPVDAFILKLDPLGNFIWAKTIGSPTTTMECNDIYIDNINELLIGGSFNDLVDFDPNSAIQYLSTGSSSDAYLLKLSNLGSFLWAKSFEGNTYSSIKSIETDNSNNIIIAGDFIGTLDLNPGPASNSITSKTNSTDIFINKLTISGNYINGKSFGGNSEDNLTTMRLDYNGNVFLAGNFSGTCDFDPNISVANLTAVGTSQDFFIQKLNSNLDYLWAKKIGGAGDEKLNDIFLDNVQNIYATGLFSGTVDFNPGIGTNVLTSSGDFDIFLTKLTSNGDYLKANKIGNSNNDGGISIFIDNFYSIFSSGIYNNTVDFDPTASTENLTASPSVNGDIYTFQWNQCSPDIINYYGSGCNFTLNGQTYSSNGLYYQIYTNIDGCDSILYVNISESSSNTVLNISNCVGNYSFNGQNYTSSGTYIQNYTNVFGCDSNYTLNLYLGGATYTTLNESACSFYFWNNQIYFNSGVYIDTFSNFNGCDSIVTLNLSIYQPTSNVVYDTSCGSVTYNGVTYNSSGVYNNLFTTVNGCDSVVDYNLTIIPVPVTYIVDTACEIYSLNGQNYVSSGTYSQELTSVNGCDSNINLSIVIYNINKGITQTGNFLSSNQLQPSNYQWIICNPFALIPNATGKNYTATSNGLYGVILSANGCSDTSNCIQVTLDNINDFDFKNLIQIFPNPTSDIINLKFSGLIDESLKIKIKTISGQTVLESSSNNQSSIQIPVKDLSKGIYFVEIANSSHKTTLKFIKE
jgi:hypothetical protein